MAKKQPTIGESKKTRNLILTVIALAVLLVLCYFIGDGAFGSYINRLVRTSCAFAIAAISLNLIEGLTGQFSLGSAGFMAIGAYTVALCTIKESDKMIIYFVTPPAEFIQHLSLPFPVALLLGACFAAAASFLIGFPVLRLKSDYLGIASLGFSEIIRIIFTNITPITNSSLGLKNIPGTANIWWCVGTLIVVVVLVMRLMKGSYGRSFKAIRDDEVAAEAMGINLFKHKMLSFVFSSFLAGIAGGLIASIVTVITPMYFRFTLAYEILLIVVLGGMGSITGSIVAGFVVTFAKEGLRFLDDGWKLFGIKVPGIAGARMLAFSIFLMIIILFFRRGLFGSNEFSWDGLFRLCKRIGGAFTGAGKKQKGGAKA